MMRLIRALTAFFAILFEQDEEPEQTEPETSSDYLPPCSMTYDGGYKRLVKCPDCHLLGDEIDMGLICRRCGAPLPLVGCLSGQWVGDFWAVRTKDLEKSEGDE